MTQRRPPPKGHRKGRRDRSSFLMLPHPYLDSEQYAKLSPRAVKALIDIAAKYRGKNNGDLAANWADMLKRGWTSKDQLYKAIHELIDLGWLVITRVGGKDREQPTLYALTIWGIDECGGKLDPGVTADPRPLHLWKLPGLTTNHGGKARRTVKRSVRQTDRFSTSSGLKVVNFNAHQSARRAESATYPRLDRSA